MPLPQEPVPTPPAPGGSAMRGIAFKVASVVAFVGMAMLIKLAAEEVPVGQLVFYRSIFALVPVMLYLLWRGQLRAGLRTSNPLGHLLRGLIGVISMVLTFLALAMLPLPEATAIGYAAPFFIIVLSALLLKEPVRLYRWSAVLVGLAGVLVVIWPRLTLLSRGLEAGEATGALVGLAAALGSAFAMLQVRRLVRSESTTSIVVYFSLSAAAFSLVSAPFGWIWPDPRQAALLIGAGILGGIGQIFLTSAYRYADMSIIAPFEYTSMLLAVVIGLAVFGDAPTLHMLAGGAIVVASGIFVVLRERQLGLDRAAARQATPP